jgi:membrane protease subunit HflK
MNPNQQEQPEINFDQVAEKLRSLFGGKDGGSKVGGRGLGLFIFGIFIVAAIIWVSTGFYSVQPGEQAALRHFGVYQRGDSGAFIGGTEPGLHWYFPAPIGTRAIVQVDEIRRLELGVRGNTPIPIESLMISGDTNIVDVQLLVQYNVKDVEDFLFRVVDPGGAVIKGAAESALRLVVGQRIIDDVLTTEKESVQSDTRVELQRLLDLYETGINVTEVKLQNVRPPSQVQDAFDDVVRAREDKERIVNLAQAYEADVLPRALGEAQRVLELAEAFKQEKVADATGESARFLAVLAEYRKSKNVTRQRLYLEAMETILPGITKYIIDGDSGGNLLQFLPLTNDGTEGTNSSFGPLEP